MRKEIRNSLKENEYNLSNLMANSRMNSESVLADSFSSSFGNDTVSKNGQPVVVVPYVLTSITDGSTKSVVYIDYDMSAITIQSGDILKFTMLQFITADIVFAHDLWNVLYTGTNVNLFLPITIRPGVGNHDVELFRMTLGISGPPPAPKLKSEKLYTANRNSVMLGEDPVQTPCPVCGKLAILKVNHLGNYGYCAKDGKFIVGDTLHLVREQAHLYLEGLTLVHNAWRSINSCPSLFKATYNQWCKLSKDSPIRDQFIFEHLGLEYFFTLNQEILAHEQRLDVIEESSETKSHGNSETVIWDVIPDSVRQTKEQMDTVDPIDLISTVLNEKDVFISRSWTEFIDLYLRKLRGKGVCCFHSSIGDIQ